MAEKAKSFDEARQIFEAAMQEGGMTDAPTIAIPADADAELTRDIYTWSEGDEPIYIQAEDGRVIKILSAEIVSGPETAEEAAEETAEELLEGGDAEGEELAPESALAPMPDEPLPSPEGMPV